MIEHYIFGLEISVNNTMVMQCFKSLKLIGELIFILLLIQVQDL